MSLSLYVGPNPPSGCCHGNNNGRPCTNTTESWSLLCEKCMNTQMKMLIQGISQSMLNNPVCESDSSAEAGWR